MKPATPPGQVVRRPEVIDDFVRNFFVRMGLSRTAEVFEAEWYELKATGRLEAAGSTVVPDIYLRNGVSVPARLAPGFACTAIVAGWLGVHDDACGCAGASG